MITVAQKTETEALQDWMKATDSGNTEFHGLSVIPDPDCSLLGSALSCLSKKVSWLSQLLWPTPVLKCTK